MFSEQPFLIKGRSDAKSFVENCQIEGLGNGCIRDEDLLMIKDSGKTLNKAGNMENRDSIFTSFLFICSVEQKIGKCFSLGSRIKNLSSIGRSWITHRAYEEKSNGVAVYITEKTEFTGLIHIIRADEYEMT